MIYDSIIVGKGPAGIQAALYMKRANLNILVIGKDGGSLEKAEKIENFYGQETALSGEELINKGISQIEKLGAQVITDEVVGIELIFAKTTIQNTTKNDINNGIKNTSQNDIENEENQVNLESQFNEYNEANNKIIFKVKTVKNEYTSKTIIMATGTNRKAPLIKGIKELEGRGVSYCAVCDGFFYKDKSVAVIGNGNYAISEVEALLPITNKITILTNGKDEVLVRNKNVECNTKKISAVTGEKKVEKIIFKDNTVMNVSGIFIAEGIATSLDLAKKIGAEIEGDKLVVDNNTMQTSIPGIYAAGDCTGEIYQISKAVYEGMKAGLAVIKYLKE